MEQTMGALVWMNTRYLLRGRGVGAILELQDLEAYRNLFEEGCAAPPHPNLRLS